MPPAETPPAWRSPTRICFLPASSCLGLERQRLLCLELEILHHHRVYADPHNPIAFLKYFTFRSDQNLLTIHKERPPVALPECRRVAEELQGNRRWRRLAFRFLGRRRRRRQGNRLKFGLRNYLRFGRFRERSRRKFEKA